MAIGTSSSSMLNKTHTETWRTEGTKNTESDRRKKKQHNRTGIHLDVRGDVETPQFKNTLTDRGMI